MRVGWKVPAEKPFFKGETRDLLGLQLWCSLNSPAKGRRGPWEQKGNVMPVKSRKAVGKTGLRSWRQKLDLGKALIVGPRNLDEIVYAYRFPSKPDRLKIGYSSRGLERVVEQSTGFPEKPVVIFVIHHKDAKNIEKSFHRALASRQADVLGTEWFDVSLSQLLRISPALRHAAGVSRRWRWVKIAASGMIGALGIAAAPVASAATTALLTSKGQLAVLDRALAYQQNLRAGEVTTAMDFAAVLFNFAFGQDLPKILPAVPLLLIPLLMRLPWLNWRRQAF